MSERLRDALKRSRDTDRRCEVVWCQTRTKGASRYCRLHHLRDQRHGHPEATTIHAYQLRPYLKLARFYIATAYANHAEVQKALARITAFVPRTLPWLTRLSPESTLAVVVACYLMFQHGPEQFESGRHFAWTIATRVARRSTRKHKAGRLNVTQLNRIAETLKREIGQVAMSMALAIFQANRTPNPDGTYLLRGVNLPVRYPTIRRKSKKERNDRRK